MKKIELFFSFILVPIDFALLLLAGISAYYIRFSESFVELRPVIFDLPFNEYFRALLFVIVLWIIIFAFSSLYSNKIKP
jgi:hypothetical protein